MGQPTQVQDSPQKQDEVPWVEGRKRGSEGRGRKVGERAKEGGGGGAEQQLEGGGGARKGVGTGLEQQEGGVGGARARGGAGAGFEQQPEEEEVEAAEGGGPSVVRLRGTTVQQLHFPPRRQLQGLRSWETADKVSLRETGRERQDALWTVGAFGG